MVVGAISGIVPLLLLCPLVMGLMMWFMMRGMGNRRPGDAGEKDESDSLADLRAEQLRLAKKIDALEAVDVVPPEEPAPH